MFRGKTKDVCIRRINDMHRRTLRKVILRANGCMHPYAPHAYRTHMKTQTQPSVMLLHCCCSETMDGLILEPSKYRYNPKVSCALCVSLCMYVCIMYVCVSERFRA